MKRVRRRVLNEFYCGWIIILDECGFAEFGKEKYHDYEEDDIK